MRGPEGRRIERLLFEHGASYWSRRTETTRCRVVP